MLVKILISILFGIVEGITEWLPISSTGHMILLNSLIKFDVTPEFYSLYEVVIQLGAILAIILIFFKKLWPLKTAKKGPREGKLVLDSNTLLLWAKIILSTIPAVFILPFDDFFEEHFYKPIPVALALIVFGIGFILIENRNKNTEPTTRTLSALSFKSALIIGCFQVLAAVFPGTSRSGATILGALLIGVSRPVAAEYTFFLAVPAMAGASLLKLLKYSGALVFEEIILLVIGMVTAFAVSLFVVRYLMNYIRKHDFKVFGYYRIVLGILVLLYFGVILK